MDHESRDAQVKLQEVDKRFESQQRRIAVFDELARVKTSTPTGEESIIYGLAKEVTRSVMGQMETVLQTYMSKSDFERATQAQEFKQANMVRDISDTQNLLRKVQDDVLAVERRTDQMEISTNLMATIEYLEQ